MESTNITLKIQRGEDIRRVTLPKNTAWENLLSFMKRLLPYITEEEWSSLNVQYIDDEQDRCTVSSDEELKEALNLASSAGTPLKLFLVSPVPVPVPAPVPAHEAPWKCRRREILKKADSLREEGLRLMDEKKFQEAMLKFEEQCNTYRRPFRKMEPLYNIACCYALLGDTCSALHFLEKSVKFGFQDVQHLQNDEDFVSIRSEPKFQEIVYALASAPRREGRKCGNRQGGKYATAMELQARALELMSSGSTDGLKEALELFRNQASISVSNWHKRVPVYNMACCEALLGNVEVALQYLRESVDLGYKNVRHIEYDCDLKNLRGIPEFQAIIDNLKICYPPQHECMRRRRVCRRKNREEEMQESPHDVEEDPYQVQFDAQFPIQPEDAVIPLSPPPLPEMPLTPPNPEVLPIVLYERLLPYEEAVHALVEMGFVNMDILAIVVPEVEGNIQEAIPILLEQF